MNSIGLRHGDDGDEAHQMGARLTSNVLYELIFHGLIIVMHKM